MSRLDVNFFLRGQFIALKIAFDVYLHLKDSRARLIMLDAWNHILAVKTRELFSRHV